MTADFAIVGCGLQGRGMGWFHALQIKSGACPSARLTDVVEPWFLGGGKDSAPQFQDLVKSWSDVQFAPGFESLFAKSTSPVKIALIAGRTSDNPKLFRAAINAGATHVLLEKPGAPTVDELEAMAQEPVPVYMGFIKNLAPYVSGALAVRDANERSVVTLESRNNYTRDTLGECFARNSEGLLKNMAIHELALAVQFFGVTTASLESVQVHGGECLTIGDYTDLSRVDFTLKTATSQVRIKVDRCSGDGSCATVVLDDKELYNAELVDDAKTQRVQKRIAEHPDWFSYFFTQEDEYAALKETCAAAALHGAAPKAVATIHIAIAALKLAEHLTPILKQRLENS